MIRFSHIVQALVAATLLALWPQGTAAQSDREDLDDRGYIQAFLEDNLSDVGRDIRIIGFSGALSSRATIDQITIADDEGIWLTLNDVGLGWNRSALLSGVLDISELSAEEILLTRRPIPVGGLPAPEASGFSLPELPISVDVVGISSPRIVLGEDLLGQGAVLRLKGEAHLSGGEGRATFLLERTDGKDGKFSLEGLYSNTTTQTVVDLQLEEEEDGIAANLLNLPGRPSLALSVQGEGPLHDFTADLALATDGQDRLSGQIELTGQAPSDDPNAPATDQAFRVNLSGDIAPVFVPEFREFFGDNINLTASGSRAPDGALQLDQMDLKTEALVLAGSLALSPDGWPERFALTGRIAHDDGAPVLLPMSGPRTRIKGADLDLSYDSADGEDWTARLVIADLTRPDLTLNIAQVSAGGALRRGDGAAIGAVTGALTLALQGIAPSDPALAKAIGPRLSGRMGFDWQEDAPIRFSDLSLTGSDYELTGAATLADLKTGGVLDLSEGLALTASDLSRFDDLVGLPLRGEAALTLRGSANLLGGAFDLRLSGETRALAINQPRIDPILAGVGSLDLLAIRDENGTRIAPLTIRTDLAEIVLSADLKTDATTGQFDLDLKDTSAVEPGLTGALKLTGTVQQKGQLWMLDTKGTGPGGAEISGDARVTIGEDGPGVAKGALRAKIASLVPYRGLTGQALSGSMTLAAEGDGDLRDGSFNLSLSGNGQDLSIGQPMLDPLTRGASTLTLTAHRDADAPVMLDALNLNTAEVTLEASGSLEDGRNVLDFKGQLRDLALLAGEVSGPLRAEGRAVLAGESWDVNLRGEGPNDTRLRVDGQLASDGSRGDLDITGSAHLALLNPMIRPRLLSGLAGIDLRLSGPLALSSLSGNIAVSSGQLVLPTYQIAMNLPRANVALAGGQAQVDVTALVTSGGTITASGPVSLSSPFNADLAVRANAVHLSDGNIYDTTLDGEARLSGPLAGGASIRADLELGATEIRVPEATPSSLPVMEGLVHVNEPAAVRATRKAAGLISDGPPPAPARAYPLDIRLSAPSRVFVRGRGLDAELGGELRLSGTSANVIPQGQFNLIRGRLDILGKRLDLTTGRVSLRGGFDPILLFIAEAKTDEADISITVEGPASSPTVTFASSPDRPQDEVLALLLFGRNITEISPLQALRMAAAVRTLAGKGGEGIIGKLRGSFGLDDLDVSTDADGVANLRVGKYISENIYTDVTVGSDGTSEVNLNLNLSPSFTARGSVTSDGESKLGIFFERDY
ncbi:translocation/assembly module TamB domain-containing protein [Aliiroseovarius crassostreae]|uniref:translocation/assembly module TamB domain-containing protein n=1 Tax=Aliiroseovarius crassostreae TaxID=154981 RepID=UPI003C7A3237